MNPCDPWVDDWDHIVGCYQKAAALDDPTIQDGIMAYASEVLFKLSQRRYPGACETTRHPACSCGRYRCGGSTVRLDPGPVLAVVEVIVDGAVVPSDEYRVIDRRDLLRVGGTWPHRADLAAAPDEAGSFIVTWRYGAAVPEGGHQAARRYACELAKRASGDDCEIPDRVTNVTREGVTMSFLPPIQAVLDAGRTGVYEVDMWLEADARDAAHHPSRIINPRRPRPVVVD